MPNQTKEPQKIETTRGDTDKIVSRNPIAWGAIGIGFSALGFVVLFAGFYLGLMRLNAGSLQLAEATTAMQSQIMQNNENTTALKQDVSGFQQVVQDVHEQLTSQQQALNELHHAQQGNKEDWSVSEAQYLVKLANDNLQLGENIPLIISLLTAADQKLQEINDANLLPLRKALAADIAALQAVPQTDTAGIYLQLSALNDQVDKMPLPNLRPDQDKSMVEVTEDSPWWKRGLQQTLAALRQIVIIRYNQSGKLPFISPDLHSYLYQNLHAMLEQALFAVLRKQPEIYRASLTQAQNWITQYFLQDSSVTQAELAALKQLQDINIKPQLPTLSASLDAFRSYLSQPATATKPALTSSI